MDESEKVLRAKIAQAVRRLSIGGTLGEKVYSPEELRDYLKWVASVIEDGSIPWEVYEPYSGFEVSDVIVTSWGSSVMGEQAVRGSSDAFQFLAQLVRILDEAVRQGHEIHSQIDGFGHEREIRVTVNPVGAATKYTTKAPEVAGWYWLRDRDHLEIVQVLANDSGEMGWDGVTGWQAFQAGWEWRGPIEVPK